MCRFTSVATCDLYDLPTKTPAIEPTLTRLSKKSSASSTSSYRSKFTSNAKLTKNGLFKVINAPKHKFTFEQDEEMSLEIQLLEDALGVMEITEEENRLQMKNNFKQCLQECRKVLRGLEHFDC